MKVFNKEKAKQKLKLKQNKNKYIKYGTIGLSCLILIVAVLVFTFAYFESKIEFTIINGKVDGQLQDVNTIAIYQGEDKVDSIPAKGSGWDFDRADCTNGATASWNVDSWSLILNFTTKTKCSIYFKVQEAVPVSSACDYLSGNCDLETIGSEIRIGSEEFYVIGQEDSSHVKLLSKWNLNVGSNAKGEATNLQDEDVRGYRRDGGTKYGNVAFSITNYWLGSNQYQKPAPAYGSSYPAYVYDSNSNIKQYVDTYVTYLNTQGVNVSGRLIKQEELVALGCNASTFYCDSNETHGGTAPSWVYQTSYWSGTAPDNINVWRVNSSGSFGSNYCDYGDTFGVRPVIILEK